LRFSSAGEDVLDEVRRVGGIPLHELVADSRAVISVPALR